MDCNFEILNSSMDTIKNTSYDSAHNEYMSESQIEIINFDSVKTKYVNKRDLSEEDYKSVDGLFLKEETKFFLEFKNGNKIKRKKIIEKIKDSILIFCDIINSLISETKKDFEFILVYNEEKNSIKDNEPTFLKDIEINLEEDIDLVKEKSRSRIGSILMKKSGKEYVRFGLQKYANFYFKDVHTFNEKEFEDYLNKLN